jgi:hypothetical protein
VSLSPADQSLVATLAGSQLKNYTNELVNSSVGNSRAVTTVDAGNALGSLTVGSSGYTLFIIQNTGTAPLYNVQFTVSDKASDGSLTSASDFTLVPGTLTTLNTSGSSSFEPLVTLNIQHGNVIANGGTVAGSYNYLPYKIPASANVTATVTIYAWSSATDGGLNADGSTASYSNNSTADNQLIATLNVTVQRAAWEIDDSSNGTALLPGEGPGGNYGGSGNPAHTTPYIKNTGNVVLSLKEFSDPTATTFTTVSVPVGQSVPITYLATDYATFWIDTSGIVYNWNITSVSGVTNAVFWQAGTSQTGQLYAR